MYFDEASRVCDDEVSVEYNVYDVSPDVSIDFLSFTTEESEGESLVILN